MGQRYGGVSKLRTKKKNFYFTQEVEDAIVEYNNCTDSVTKNLIYSNTIHPVFYKLVEIMINRFKFHNFDVPVEDVKYEVISFLFERMNKYKKENGRAFSYFSIIAKNYLIAENNKNYYKFKAKQNIQSIDEERNVVNDKLRQDMIEERNDFIDNFIEVIEANIKEIFPRQRDSAIAETILYLFKNRINIENYNKKAMYILIRERVIVDDNPNVRAMYITAVINKMKNLYKTLYRMYRNESDIYKLTGKQLQNISRN
ncbi:hypothetical protein [Microcystis phage Mel-JY01]